MIEVPALKIQQQDVVLLVTALPLGELRKHAKVDYYRPDNPEGYQRPLVDRRLADIGKYVTVENGVLPTSVLVCVRDEDSNPPRFIPDGRVGDFAQNGTLSIPDGAILWLVDGQHRHFGVNRAYERGASELADFAFPVTVMMGVDRFVEMKHFSTINTQQRKMLTDIVDRHMVMRAQHEGLHMISSGKRGERDYQRAKSTRITDALDEKPGPWYHQIQIPGVEGRDRGLFRQHGMVASLESIHRDALLSPIGDDDVAELLARYWRALAKVWPDAFEDPGSYRVQATVGVYSLHMVFPTVVHLCMGEGGPTEDKMREVWEATGIPPSFWHKEDGDPLTLGTGMASIRAIAQHFREQLPTRQAVTI